jgi:tetratricopeptide (TPR) repeat protein
VIGFTEVVCIAAVAVAAAPNVDAPELPERVMVEKALELERGREALDQLKTQLETLEQSNAKILRARNRGGLLDPETAALAMEGIPDEVETETMRLKRFATEKGLAYDVSAQNVPVRQVLESISKTAGIGLQLHPDVSNDHLRARIWLNQTQVDIHSLVEVVAGTQGLGCVLDKDGMLVAPPTALTNKSVQMRLREQAVEAYEKALLRYPAGTEAPNAYLGLARYYVNSGQETMGLQNARRVIERYPDSKACPGALLLVASCHERAKRYPDARRIYQRYLERFAALERAPGVMLRMAETWIIEGHLDQAMPVLEDVIRAYPTRNEGLMARMKLAECLAAQGQDVQAVSQLTLVEKSGKTVGDPAKLRLLLAQCLVRLKQYVKARNRLLYAIHNAKSRDLAEEAYYAMGDVFLAEGKSVAALEAYGAAMQRFPDGPNHHLAPLRICNALLEMGLFIRVQARLEGLPDDLWAAREIRPIILTMAGYYLQNREPRRALALILDERLPFDPDTDPELLLLRARAHLQSESPRRAKAYAVNALRLTDDDALETQASILVGRCEQVMDNGVLAARAYAGMID